MEKPIRPLKPKKIEPRMPQQTNCARYYVMRCYHPQSGQPTIQIIDDIPALSDHTDEADIFYENNWHHDRITFAELLSFAERKNISPIDLEIVSLEVDNYLTGLEIRHNTRLDDNVYQQLIESWKQDKQRAAEDHQQAVAQWRLDLEQYKRDKAAYDVFKAQQKLNSL